MIYLHRANAWTHLRLAAANGWGVEIDVRTHRALPYLSHDAIVAKEDAIPLEDAMRFLAQNRVPTILDFKETGIVDAVLEAMPNREAKSLCVATDMIVPDQLVAERRGLRTLSRWSSMESINGAFWGRWMDYIRDPEDVRELLKGKTVPPGTLLVSPELHGHPLKKEFVVFALGLGFQGICTDYPLRYRPH